MSNEKPFYSVAELAARWSISRNKVLALIHNGTLAAVDLNEGSGLKPCWRISEIAVAKREGRQPADVAPSKRPKVPDYLSEGK